ncbi:MAG: hypothetical protein FE78DRAFT_381916 [Acidomyces sp. 'richmondensis']|nr:MAG: hypothetical protein FE78DRAFT_381916 [Acidomyces sp. 'richmondensis']
MVITVEEEARYYEAKEKNRDYSMATSINYADLARNTPRAEHKSPRSPDQASPIYPERAIRPLPKSRLKSKLSPEQASSIVFPPDPPSLSPTLQFNPDIEKRRALNGHAVGSTQYDNGRIGSHANGHRESDHGHCTCQHGDADSGDEEIEFDHPDYRYPASSIGPLASGGSGVVALPNGAKPPLDSVQRRLLEASRAGLKPAPPGSTGSSADGYESFENTSNKKKRKIPLSSANTVVQSQLSAEIAGMAISQQDGAMEDGTDLVSTQSYTPPVLASGTGTGISGAGRGRYGRQNVHGRNGERRPLGSGTLNISNGYGPRLPRDHKDSSGIENTGGIISQAIKSAAEQGPLTPQKNGSSKDCGNSLLQSTTNTTPKTQFTFSCGSESATKMEQQHQQAKAAAAAQRAAHQQQQASGGYGAGTPGAFPSTSPAGGVQIPYRGGPPAKAMTSHSAQTTPSLRQGGGSVNGVAARPPPAQAPIGQQAPPAPAAAPKPKPRRRPSKEYALAARQRQVQQEYTNLHHPPTKDNMWICEFCEYEDIFGVPPVAMIRKYEIKDRQLRKEAAERRRLLEKAKLKGRKGKKGKGKSNNSNAASTNPPMVNGTTGTERYDPDIPQPEGEEYFDDECDGDEYADEYDPVDPNESGYYPPPPASTPNVQTPGPPPPPSKPLAPQA